MAGMVAIADRRSPAQALTDHNNPYYTILPYDCAAIGVRLLNMKCFRFCRVPNASLPSKPHQLGTRAFPTLNTVMTRQDWENSSICYRYGPMLTYLKCELYILLDSAYNFCVRKRSNSRGMQSEKWAKTVPVRSKDQSQNQGIELWAVAQ